MPPAAAKARRLAKARSKPAAVEDQAKLRAEIEHMRSFEYFMEQVAAIGGSIKRDSIKRDST